MAENATLAAFDSQHQPAPRRTRANGGGQQREDSAHEHQCLRTGPNDQHDDDLMGPHSGVEWVDSAALRNHEIECLAARAMRRRGPIRFGERDGTEIDRSMVIYATLIGTSPFPGGVAIHG